MRTLPYAAQLYILIVLALATAMTVVCTPAVFANTFNLALFVVFACLIALFDLYPVVFKESQFETTVSTAIKIAGILLFDPRVVVVATCFGTAISEARIERAPVKKAFNIGQMTLTDGVLAATYLLLHEPVRSVFFSLHEIAVLAALAFVELGFNNLAVSMIVALTTRTSVITHWLEGSRPIILHNLSMVPLGAFIAILWNASPWAILFAAIPLVLVRNSYQLVGELRRQTFNALSVLARMLDERDEHTHRHCEHVAEHAREVALLLGLKPSDIEVIHRAAYLHDIGKIGMSNEILFKPDVLTPHERELAKRHAVYGGDLLKQFPMFEEGALYVRHHHERWDGTGYPDGLKGKTIPLGARILNVADSFQAMIEDRPYRRGMDVASALREIEANAGTQFDPEVAAAFIQAKSKLGLSGAGSARQPSLPIAEPVR